MTPQEFKKLVAPEQTVLIISSRPLDFDCLGSGLMLKKYLESLGKTVKLSFPLPFTEDNKDLYSILPYFEEVEDRETREVLSKQNFDLLVLVDGVNWSQFYGSPSADEVDPEIKVYPKRIHIDHHPQHPETLGTTNIWSNEVSSTGELILTQIIPEEFVDSKIATLGYAAILGDTGCFRWELHPSSFELTGKLLQKGAQALEVIDRFFYSKTPDYLQTLAYAIKNVEYYPNLQTSFVFLPWEKIQQDKLDPLELNRLKEAVKMDLAKAVKGYPRMIFMREIAPGKIGIDGWANNLRNNIRLPDVFRALGGNGGGHFNAAGALIEGDFGKIKISLLDLLEKNLKISLDSN